MALLVAKGREERIGHEQYHTDVICAFVVKWALVMATGSLASARIEVHSNPVDELARGQRFSRKGCIGGTIVKH